MYQMRNKGLSLHCLRIKNNSNNEVQSLTTSLRLVLKVTNSMYSFKIQRAQRHLLPKTSNTLEMKVKNILHIIIILIRSNNNTSLGDLNKQEHLDNQRFHLAARRKKKETPDKRWQIINDI